MKWTSTLRATGMAGLLALPATLGLAANAPVTIPSELRVALVAVAEIQSVGGDAGFCPSEPIRQQLVSKLSGRSEYGVQLADSLDRPPDLIVTGTVNCSLGQRQRQQGILLLQERFIITTATVKLNLQVADPATGTTIVTAEGQGRAQTEAKAPNLPEMPGDGRVNANADSLLSQATVQALDQALPQVQTALSQRGR